MAKSITKEDFECLLEGLHITEDDAAVLYDRLAVKAGWKKVNVRTNEFIAAYLDEYEARYGAKVTLSGRDKGLAKTIVTDLGLPSAITLIRTYFQMNEGFFITRHHPLSLFHMNLQKVQTFHQTRRTVTRREADRMERREGNLQAFAKHLGGRNGTGSKGTRSDG